MASSRRRYEWAYLFSFVRPSSGETVNFIGSTVLFAIMSAVLRDFAEAAGLGPKRRAVVVLDGAGWHTARDLVVPEGVHIVKLPAYSPSYSPLNDSGRSSTRASRIEPSGPSLIS